MTVETTSFDGIYTEERGSHKPAPHPRSLLRPQSEPKFKQTLTVRKSLLKKNKLKFSQSELMKSEFSSEPKAQPMQEPQTSKFRKTVNIKPSNLVLNEHTMKLFNNKMKAIRKRKAQAEARERKKKPTKANPVKKQQIVKAPPELPIVLKRPKAIIDVQHSGEIIKVQRVNDDEDVDILSHSEDELNGKVNRILLDEEIVDDSRGSWQEDHEQEELINIDKKLEELKDIDPETLSRLCSLDTPNSEIILEPSNISNLERFMHPEFFVQRPTKTPERYLKIRNHVVHMWNLRKPQYLSKTCARNGLKKCGDVNAISRIHQMLEQTGVINFNCDVVWIRPLSDLYKLFQGNMKTKKISFTKAVVLENRPRIRDKADPAFAQGTNFTISHNYSS